LHTSRFPIDTYKEIDQIKIAFDADAVLFSDESERIYQELRAPWIFFSYDAQAHEFAFKKMERTLGVKVI
jgi:hypothetical protein